LITYQNILLNNENSAILGLKKILTEDVQYKLNLELSNNCIGSDSVKIIILTKPAFSTYSSNYFERNEICKKDTSKYISFIPNNYSKSNFKSLFLFKTMDSNKRNATLINSFDILPTQIKIPSTDTGSFYLFSQIFTENGCSEFSKFSSLKTVLPISEAIIHIDSNKYVCLNQRPKSPFYITNINTFKDSITWFTFDYLDKTINQINNHSFSYLPEPSSVDIKKYFFVITKNEFNCEVKSDIDSIIWKNPINVQTFNFRDSVYCNNENPIELIISSGIDYNRQNIQWYRSINKDGNSPFLIQGATDSIFYPITNKYLLNSDTNYYFAIINDKLEACPFKISPVSGKIILKYPTFKTNPSTDTYKNCFLSNNFSYLNIEINFDFEWIPVYSWYKSTTNSYKDGILISPETQLNYFQPSTDIIDTSYYYAVLRQVGSKCYNITDTSKISGPFITYPIPKINFNFLDSIVCINSTNINIEIT
ncbi:MAG: hypothetical protein ORN58_04940, partial [Sediminibacterium sp.]|nr:hypothetical protein [Sediminibacterium sp.]